MDNIDTDNVSGEAFNDILKIIIEIYYAIFRATNIDRKLDNKLAINKDRIIKSLTTQLLTGLFSRITPEYLKKIILKQKII